MGVGTTPPGGQRVEYTVKETRTEAVPGALAVTVPWYTPGWPYLWAPATE